MEPLCPAQSGGQGGWGPLCRGEGTVGQRDPQCPVPGDAPRQNHLVSPALLGILKASPNPACNQGDVDHPQVPPSHAGVVPVVLKMLLCLAAWEQGRLHHHRHGATGLIAEHGQRPCHGAHGPLLTQGFATRVPPCPALSPLSVPPHLSTPGPQCHPQRWHIPSCSPAQGMWMGTGWCRGAGICGGLERV